MPKENRRNTQQNAGVPKDTLVMIGNGFDIWQGLDTSYSNFEEYYHQHLDEILKKLRIKKRTLYDKNGDPEFDKDGKPILFSDVELFYGDPFEPSRLPHSFWNTFESSLDKLDDQQLNYYFGKERAGLKGIKKGADNARRILRQAFCDWIATIDIERKDAGFRFGDNCLFINFNYTDTLIKRFGVKEDDEYHIHGEASDKESIIFGHATHPEYPLPQLYRMKGRFRGLFYIEEALYCADKHVEDNYIDLCMFLACHGTMVEDIKNIYVLGHSFGAADIDYFKHIICATQGIDEDPEGDLTEQEREYLDHMDAAMALQLNLQYAIHHRERALGKKPIPYPLLEKLDRMIFAGLQEPYYHMSTEEQFRLEAAAVRRRFFEEQAVRNARKEKMFYKMLYRAHRKELYRTKGRSGESVEAKVSRAPVKTDTPQWHISYFSPKSKGRIENVMKTLGCENYTLYPSIDECLAPFKI